MEAQTAEDRPATVRLCPPAPDRVVKRQTRKIKDLVLHGVGVRISPRSFASVAEAGHSTCLVSRRHRFNSCRGLEGREGVRS